MSTIDWWSPSEIIGKVMSRYSVGSVHPLVERTIGGVYVLNVTCLADNPDFRNQIDWARCDANFQYSSTRCFATIGSENRIALGLWLERCTDLFPIGLLQHKIKCVSGTITANQHWNLIGGKIALGRHATVAYATCVSTLKIILGIGQPLIGRMVYYDDLNVGFHELKLKNSLNCQCCGKEAAQET